MKVYLSIALVHKRRGGISDLSKTWVRASWVARGTGTVVYKGKQCGAVVQAQAVHEAARLARRWLANENVLIERYTDTTEEPSRFGGPP